MAPWEIGHRLLIDHSRLSKLMHYSNDIIAWFSIFFINFMRYLYISWKVTFSCQMHEIKFKLIETVVDCIGKWIFYCSSLRYECQLKKWSILVGIFDTLLSISMFWFTHLLFTPNISIALPSWYQQSYKIRETWRLSCTR